MQQPRLQDLRSRDRLDAHRNDPKITVQPAAHECCPASEAKRCVLGERAIPRLCKRHFTEHAHDEKYQKPAEGVAQEHCRPGNVDGGAAADEDAGADDPAERDHGNVTRPQRVCQYAYLRHSLCVDARQE